jgi:hypothetical protein
MSLRSKETKFLKGKEGLVVDTIGKSYDLKHLFEIYGGEIVIEGQLSESLSKIIEKEGFDFVIIHNYLVTEINIILEIHKLVENMILIERMNIPPEQEQEHDQLIADLEEVGAHIIETQDIGRWEMVINRLKELYGVED